MTECFCGYKIVAHMARHQRTCKKFAIQTLQEKYIAKIESLKRRLGEDGDPEERSYGETVRSKRAKSKGKIAIYAIVHKATSRPVYVGKTSNVERRFREHASYKSQCRLLRDTFLKKGKASFEIRALMYCSESDADKNESIMITKMNTIHPNGLNLRCGSMAGVEEIGNVLTKGNLCTTMVEFDNLSEECNATADAWSNISEMLNHVGEDVDDVCRKWLKCVHPDATSASFTAAEVAAIVNNIRDAAGKK